MAAIDNRPSYFCIRRNFDTRMITMVDQQSSLYSLTNDNTNTARADGILTAPPHHADCHTYGKRHAIR